MTTCPRINMDFKDVILCISASDRNTSMVCLWAVGKSHSMKEITTSPLKVVAKRPR